VSQKDPFTKLKYN